MFWPFSARSPPPRSPSPPPPYRSTEGQFSEEEPPDSRLHEWTLRMTAPIEADVIHSSNSHRTSAFEPTRSLAPTVRFEELPERQEQRLRMPSEASYFPVRAFDDAGPNISTTRYDGRVVDTLTIHVDFVEGGDVYWRNEGHQSACECQHCETLRSKLERIPRSEEAGRRPLGRGRRDQDWVEDRFEDPVDRRHILRRRDNATGRFSYGERVVNDREPRSERGSRHSTDYEQHSSGRCFDMHCR